VITAMEYSYKRTWDTFNDLFDREIMGPDKNRIWLEWIWRMLRVILGIIFIYASFDKIINPNQFSYALSNYKLIPDNLVNISAIFLPWAEATVGICLIAGIYEWVSVTLYNGLMLIFIAAIVISLARGLNISCGCFTSDPNAEKMTWLTLLRDASLLIPGMAAYPLLLYLRRPPFLKED